MSSPRQLVSDSSPFHISPDSKINTKSLSLGRTSGKNEKNKSSLESSSPRPKSMVMSIPSVSSNAELTCSIQASPSMAFSTSSRGDQKESLMEDYDDTSTSASKYLSSAQQKDKVRRNKTITTSTTIKPPLSSKNNQDQRTRKTSLPSLIRSPIVASPSPVSALVSPAAAIIGGQAQQEEDTFSDEGAASDTLSTPPSPSPRPAAFSPLASNHATNLPIKPPSKDVVQSNNTSHSNNSTSITTTTSNTKITEMTRTKSRDEDTHDTALALLRRFKGVEGYGLLDKAKVMNMDSMTVKESSNEQQKLQEEKKNKKGEFETEQPKYPFTIRKSRTAALVKSQGLVANQKSRSVEAKYDLAIVKQSALSWSFRQPNKKNTQIAVRRLITTPIPSIFGCDRAAVWTVERVSRLTSCLIQVFGS